jgi:hypothetical protein
MVRKIALGILLASVAGAASAVPAPGGYVCTKESFWFWTWENCEKSKKTVAAPEIDPASAMGGLTLMVGGLLVLRGRRSKVSKA